MVGIQRQDKLLGGLLVPCATTTPVIVGVLLEEENERRDACLVVVFVVVVLKSLEMLRKSLETLFVHGTLPGGVQEEIGMHVQEERSVYGLPLLFVLLLVVVVVAAGALRRPPSAACKPRDEVA